MIKEIESRAEEILLSLKINSVPIPVDEIAKKNNILISSTSSTEFSGLLLRKEDGPSFIAVNSKESLVRQRFTIAHELGHYFLHHQKNTFIEFRDNKKSIIRGEKEIQANQFAAALLIPKKLLEKDVTTFHKEGVSSEHIRFLAKKYSVSENTMNFRLINLNLLK